MFTRSKVSRILIVRSARLQHNIRVSVLQYFFFGNCDTYLHVNVLAYWFSATLFRVRYVNMNAKRTLPFEANKISLNLVLQFWMFQNIFDFDICVFIAYLNFLRSNDIIRCIDASILHCTITFGIHLVACAAVEVRIQSVVDDVVIVSQCCSADGLRHRLLKLLVVQLGHL